MDESLAKCFCIFGRSLFKSHIPRNPWSNPTLDECNGVSRCVCVCVCVFLFLFLSFFCFVFFGGGGGGRELRYISNWLHFFMMQPKGRPTDRCEYRTTVPRTFQGCGILHSHNNLPRHTRLFTGKEKEAALADKTLRRVACKGDQWNAS